MLIFCVKHLFSGSGSFLVRKGGIENYSRKYDQEIKTAAGRIADMIGVSSPRTREC